MRLTHWLTLAVVAFVLTACSGQDSSSSLTTDPGNDARLILTLSAQSDTIPQATSKTLTARVTDLTGLVRPNTVSWNSSDPNIASVANGLVTGVAQGVASIIASTTGAADTAEIVVTENDVTLDVQPSEVDIAAGDTVDFVATLRTRSGDVIPVATFTWSASDTVAASFVNAGVLHAKNEGELSVTGEAMMRYGTSTVRIFRPPVRSITLSPSTTSIYRDASFRFEAILRDHIGRRIEREVKWGSSDNDKARVSQDGRVTGVGIGTVVITATAESKTASATVSVMSPAARGVELELPSATLLVGAEMQATVVATAESGEQLAGKMIAFQSSNPSIATVTSTGLVRGVKAGSVTISAIVDGIVARRSLTVRSGQPTSVQISPASPSVGIGQYSQLVAHVLDERGAPMAGPIAWSSSNPAVATVSASGLIQGIASGSSAITATSGVLSATTTVTVLNLAVASVRVSPSSVRLTAGQQGSVTAEALDANQTVLSGRVATWSSQNPVVATVTNAGVVTAVATGGTMLIATIEGKSANLPITVTSAPPAPVAAVSVSLGTASLNPGQQTQATASLTDVGGNVLSGRTVVWTSLDTDVATVSSSGQVTANGGGTVAIVASSEGKSGSASLTVSAAPAAAVARIEIEVPTQNLGVGEQVQSVVKLYDADGKNLSTAGRTIAFRSDNSSIITVSGAGLVKGIRTGTTNMRVTSGTAAATETFHVAGSASTPTVASISVTPPTSALTVGQTIQVAATAKVADGAPIAGTAFTWTTSNASVATVSSNGLVTAVGTGSATVHAAASGVTGSMSVTVTPASSIPVASITVSLSSPSVSVGGTTQASAVLRDAQGNVISGRSVAYSSSNTSIATVSSSGAVTGTSAGSAEIRATSGSVTGSANLTVTASTAPPPAPPTPPSGAAATILSVLGQTKSVAEAAAMGGDFAKYDQVFTQRLPAPSTDIWDNNYYDRAAAFYARYARTGDATFLQRAHTIVLDYRRKYLEPNAYNASPHWSQVRGVELHFRLTGDSPSRQAVGEVAGKLYSQYTPTYVGNTQNPNADNRIQARVLQGMLSAYRLNVGYGSFAASGWPTRLREVLNKVLATQNADGSYSWNAACGGQLNYQIGMLNDVLIEYYRDFEQDPRIPGVVERANEYLWTTQWRTADQAFNYVTKVCNPNTAGLNVGGPTPAGDLNGLLIASYGWLYQRTGDSKWRTRGDAIMAGLVSSRWAANYVGSKQFNQAFAESYRYLGWR